ncbi:hypothetical protein BGZ90_009726 [Linnemannia elongata]|nr:hypothetical protein BGZ90_009726 [Linnemannia elongata]
MRSTDISAFPLEIIISSITPYLTKHDLTNCVLINQQWNKIFTPLLWEDIKCVNSVSDGTAWMGDLNKIKWFRVFEKCALETGALRKNGRWIRKVDAEFCGMVDLLTGTTVGRDGECYCDGLVELEIGDDRSADMYMVQDDEYPMSQPQNVHVASVMRLLQQNQGQLRKLTFLGFLLSINAQDTAHMIRAIPSSVEELSVVKFTTPFLSSSTFPVELEPELSSLKTLAFTLSGFDNLLPILQRSPALETLVLKNLWYPTTNHVPWHVLASTIHDSCPLLTSLHLVDCPPYSDEEFSALLGASARGWKTLGFPRRYDEYGYGNNAHEFGPLSTEALLKHCATLENLRIEGCDDLPSWAIQEVLCSAPRLRRLDAISQERWRGRNVQLDAKDIIGLRDSKPSLSKDWVCLPLESLKIQITGVPRGASFNSTSIQREVYKQLGRLTGLKQLVLGHEVVHPATIYKPLEGASLEGTQPFGVPYDQRPEYRGAGYQASCLEMTLESGLGMLESLKGLRKFEVGGMDVGFGVKEELSSTGRKSLEVC